MGRIRMLKAVNKFHSGIQTIGNTWSAYLGFFGLLASAWVVVSTLLNYGRPFFPVTWGWPEAITLGFGVVCLSAAIGSFALVAWRYFRPLAAKHGTKQSLTSAIVDLQGELEALATKVSDIQGQIAIDWPNASTIAGAFRNLDDATHLKVDRIREEVTRSTDKVQTNFNETLHLLYWAADRVSAGIIARLLDEQPPAELLVPPDDQKARALTMDSISSWVSRVDSLSSEIAFGFEIRRHMEMARHRGEIKVRELPPDKRPLNLDVLAFHDYYVAVFQCEEIAGYLKYVLREIERTETQTLQKVRECLRVRKEKSS
jgi:hypothetical protein